MKFRPIFVDDTLQELTQHGTRDFPISMDRQIVCAEGCQHVKHWHHEIQIVLITYGNAVFETPAGRYDLKQGEGLFINSGVLHEVVDSDDEASTYICVDFAPEMIYGSRDSAICKDYVEPIINSPEMQSFALKDEEWHKEVLKLLAEMGETENNHEYGYELMMKYLLLRMWHIIVANNRMQAEEAAITSFSDRLRLRQLKQYIHNHYMEHLSLEDIAESVKLSRSECCRLFKRTSAGTPITYLKKYRLRQSSKLLTCTNLGIAEIAYHCGFESSSYFISCFRKEMGCTPLEFRSKQSMAL